MLMLTRRRGDSIKIFCPGCSTCETKGAELEIVLKDIVQVPHLGSVAAKIGINAPKEYHILRKELCAPGQETVKSLAL